LILNNYLNCTFQKTSKKISLEIHGFLMKNPNFLKNCVQKIKDLVFKLIEKVDIAFGIYRQ